LNAYSLSDYLFSTHSGAATLAFITQDFDNPPGTAEIQTKYLLLQALVSPAALPGLQEGFLTVFGARLGHLQGGEQVLNLLKDSTSKTSSLIFNLTQFPLSRILVDPVEVSRREPGASFVSGTRGMWYPSH